MDFYHKNIKIFFLIVFIFLSGVVFAGNNLPVEIINAIKSGDSAKLSKYFNSSIELIINDNEGVYSKAQAKLIIKDFFIKNTPVDFILIHQGGKNNAMYSIGTLSSKNKSFRVYILLKTKENTPFIHQLRIEEE